MVEASVAVLDTIDVTDSVVEVQRHEYFSNDDIQTRAQTTAGYDGGLHVLRVEVIVLSRTGTHVSLRLVQAFLLSDDGVSYRLNDYYVHKGL